MPEALQINNGSLVDTTLPPNIRGKASMHSKCGGSTQAFSSKEKGAQHLMKKVGRRKPEGTRQWCPVVPMGPTKGKALKKKSRSRDSGDAETEGQKGCKSTSAPLPQPGISSPASRWHSWPSTTCLGTESQDSVLGKSQE